MVVRTYFYPGCVRGEVKLDIPLALAIIPEAPLGQTLGPRDFLPEPLPDIEMELMSPELPTVELQPQSTIPATSGRASALASDPNHRAELYGHS